MSRDTLILEERRRLSCTLCGWVRYYNTDETRPSICPACSGSPMKAYTKVDQVTSRDTTNRYGDLVTLRDDGKCFDCGRPPSDCSPDDHK
jgi:hypothetical protein